jgi:Holliday junction DNA helicase RuvB
MTYRLDFYEEEDMLRILERSAGLLELKTERAALVEIARRCRRTPRVANRLLKRVRDYAQVHQHGRVTEAIVEEALQLLDIDVMGLDAADRRVLEAMVQRFDGGPVGLQTLAAVTAEEERTLEEVIEPFLLQCGFLQRTPRGRVVTAAGREHVGARGQAQLI